MTHAFAHNGAGAPIRSCRELLALVELSGLGVLPGDLLYSGPDTLRPGKAYVLGYNPGGDEAVENTPLLDAVRRACTRTQPWSAYLDASWRPRGRLYEPGEAPMQKRVRALLGTLGLEPRATFATNFVFVRSPDKARLADAALIEDQCWSIHEALLSTVAPELIVALDLGAFDGIRRRTSPLAEATPCHANHGSWRCMATTISLKGRKVRMVGTPGLGRYAIDKPSRTDVLEWLRSMAMAI